MFRRCNPHPRSLAPRRSASRLLGALLALLGLGVTGPYDASADTVYDFENPDLVVGTTVVNQDGWESYLNGSEMTVQLGVGVNGTRVLQPDDADPQAEIVRRKNDGNWAFPAHRPTDTSAMIQFDLEYSDHDNAKYYFGLGADSTSDGDGVVSTLNERATAIGIWERDFLIRKLAGSSTEELFQKDITAAEGAPGDWFRLNLTVDFTANGGDGNGRLYYKNLSRGDTEFQPLTTTPIDLKLTHMADDVESPATWDTMLAVNTQASGGRGGQMDNLTPKVLSYADRVIAATQPEIYWKLDELAGTTAYDLVTEDAGGANHGEYLGQAAPGGIGPRPADGLKGMAFSNSAAVTTKTAPDIDAVAYESLQSSGQIGTGEYSVQFWFSVDNFSSGSIHYLLSRSDDSSDFRDALRIVTNSQYLPPGETRLQTISFVGKDDSGSVNRFFGDTVIETDTWYHTVFTRDGDNLAVYLNGDLELSGASSWGGLLGDSLRIGSFWKSTDGQNGLDGLVDEVAVWNRALSAGEVGTLYMLARVPEPGSLGLLGLGALGLAGASQRRNRRRP